MKSFLYSNAKDKVLTAWQILKMMPTNKSVHKYIEKFWGLYLKATVYQNIELEEQKQKFCARLPDKMNKYMNLQRPKSITMMIHHTIFAL